MTERKAKIVCTLGPASSTKEVIFSLIKNGMDVARLNFSHGSYETHGKTIRIIREGIKKFRRPVAILQDLQGIKIRVSLIKGGSVLLKKDSHISVLPGDGLGDEKKLYISYPDIVKDAKKGDRILLDDGLIRLDIISKSKGALNTKVIEGGVLTDKKGVNLPFRIAAASFTPKDMADLDFGLKMGVDYVALSFVRSADDVSIVRERLKKRGPSINLIAKIEKQEALSDIERILDEADGIMIARGDLGVEVPPEEVPLIQKRLIELANRKGKIVITATQMLESMTVHTRPTRAEATDVANAIIDGTDALMLSAETASGKYPVETLKMMDKIIEYTETQYPKQLFYFELQDLKVNGFSEAVAHAACRAAEDIKARLIVAFTHSGFTARIVSKFRPRVPIISFTPAKDAKRRMSLYWGVHPKLMRGLKNTDDMIKEVERSLLSEKFAQKGDRIVITASIPVMGAGKTNFMKLHTIGE